MEGGKKMNNPKMQVFATRLKEIRNDNHMTQKEFAQKIGVTPAALSAYENNQKNPSVAVLQRIGENFDVSLTWLCGVAQRKSVNKVFTTYTEIKCISYLKNRERCQRRLRRNVGNYVFRPQFKNLSVRLATHARTIYFWCNRSRFIPNLA